MLTLLNSQMKLSIDTVINIKQSVLQVYTGSDNATVWPVFRVWIFEYKRPSHIFMKRTKEQTTKIESLKKGDNTPVI